MPTKKAAPAKKKATAPSIARTDVRESAVNVPLGLDTQHEGGFDISLVPEQPVEDRT